MKHSRRLTTREVSLIAAFAALYCVLSFLPGIKIATGSANITIQIEAFMASVFGLIVGPYLGALAAFVGAFLAWVLPPGSPTITSAVFMPAPVINAFVVGLIYTKKWKLAFVTLSAVIFAFWLLPVVQPWDQYSYVGFYAMWDKIIALLFIVPSALLLNRMLKSSKNEPVAPNIASLIGKIDLAAVVSLIAAVLIFYNAWIIGSGGDVKIEFDILGTTFKTRLISKEMYPIVAQYGYAWLSLGVGILVCVASLYLNLSRRTLWGFMISLLSSVSVIFGGGYFAGLILGVLGGILAISKTKITLPRMTILDDMLLVFLLAFIGNEADNALGNVIFALPLVHEGIFQTPLPILRGLFVIAPFFYFAVRLLQAIIATLIATPLLRNLKAAGYRIGQFSDVQK